MGSLFQKDRNILQPTNEFKAIEQSSESLKSYYNLKYIYPR